MHYFFNFTNRQPARLSSPSVAVVANTQRLRRAKDALSLATLNWVPVRIWRDRRQIVSFGLQFFLYFLKCPVELLIFASEFFRGIIVDDDVGIHAMAFDDPLFPVH